MKVLEWFNENKEYFLEFLKYYMWHNQEKHGLQITDASITLISNPELLLTTLYEFIKEQEDG